MNWDYKTITPGIIWPPIPDSQTALILSYQHFLQDSQWWSEDDIINYQFKQLHSLLSFAKKHSPFYSKRLRGIVLSEESLFSHWQDIPILTRSELHSQSAYIDARQIPKEHGNVTSDRSSGATGLAVEVKKSGLCEFLWRCFAFREHLWHKTDFNGKLAAIRYFFDKDNQGPQGMVNRNWGRITHGLVRTGPGAGMHILRPVDEQVEWLLKHNPQYLLTHPSVMLELAQIFIRENLQLSNLVLLRTISETLPDELRAISRKAWGVPLVDIYSSMETGYMALQCPDHEHYHVQSEHVYMEILEDTGRQCKPGEVGRVVVTSLHNFATPLIRYEIGDLAEVGEPCPCGRGLPVIKKIWGRYRNLVTLPNGEKKWPVCSLLFFDSPEPFRQVQLIQKSLEDIEVRIAAPRPLKQSTELLIRDYLTENLGYSFQFNFQYVDEIRRQDNGKFEEFISLL